MLYGHRHATAPVAAHAGAARVQGEASGLRREALRVGQGGRVGKNKRWLPPCGAASQAIGLIGSSPLRQRLLTRSAASLGLPDNCVHLVQTVRIVSPACHGCFRCASSDAVRIRSVSCPSLALGCPRRPGAALTPPWQSSQLAPQHSSRNGEFLLPPSPSHRVSRSPSRRAHAVFARKKKKGQRGGGMAMRQCSPCSCRGSGSSSRRCHCCCCCSCSCYYYYDFDYYYNCCHHEHVSLFASAFSSSSSTTTAIIAAPALSRQTSAPPITNHAHADHVPHPIGDRPSTGAGPPVPNAKLSPPWTHAPALHQR